MAAKFSGVELGSLQFPSNESKGHPKKKSPASRPRNVQSKPFRYRAGQVPAWAKQDVTQERRSIRQKVPEPTAAPHLPPAARDAQLEPTTRLSRSEVPLRDAEAVSASCTALPSSGVDGSPGPSSRAAGMTVNEDDAASRTSSSSESSSGSDSDEGSSSGSSDDEARELAARRARVLAARSRAATVPAALSASTPSLPAANQQRSAPSGKQEAAPQSRLALLVPSAGAPIEKGSRYSDDDSSDDSDEDSSDDSSSDSSESAMSRLGLGRFRRKRDRVTVEAREAEMAKDEAREREAADAATARRQKSKQLVQHRLREEEDALVAMAQASANGALGRPDDRDLPEDEDTDFAQWRERETARAVRDARERLPESEVDSEGDDAEGVALTEDGSRGSRGFMQKYYHRGAFYMDVDSVSKKDPLDVRHRASQYAAARTGQDHGVNKALLPKMMQVRDFGKRSRSKWTHLSNEDTSAEGERLRARLAVKTAEEARRGLASSSVHVRRAAEEAIAKGAAKGQHSGNGR